MITGGLVCAPRPVGGRGVERVRRPGRNEPAERVRVREVKKELVPA